MSYTGLVEAVTRDAKTYKGNKSYGVKVVSNAAGVADLGWINIGIGTASSLPFDKGAVIEITKIKENGNFKDAVVADVRVVEGATAPAAKESSTPRTGGGTQAQIIRQNALAHATNIVLATRREGVTAEALADAAILLSQRFVTYSTEGTLPSLGGIVETTPQELPVEAKPRKAKPAPVTDELDEI